MLRATQALRTLHRLVPRNARHCASRLASDSPPALTEAIIFRGPGVGDYSAQRQVPVRPGCTVSSAASLSTQEREELADLALSAVGPLRTQIMAWKKGTGGWQVGSANGRALGQGRNSDSDWGWGTGWLGASGGSTSVLTAAHVLCDLSQAYGCLTADLILCPEGEKNFQMAHCHSLVPRMLEFSKRLKGPPYQDWVRFGGLPACLDPSAPSMGGIPLCSSSFHATIKIGDPVFLVGRVYPQGPDYARGGEWEKIFGPTNSLSIHQGQVESIDLATGGIFHSCDSLPGFSGGPLLMRTDTGFVAVGVHSGRAAHAVEHPVAGLGALAYDQNAGSLVSQDSAVWMDHLAPFQSARLALA